MASPNPQEQQQRQITTTSSEEFLQICERHRAREFYIEMIKVGKTNGQWIITLGDWPEPIPEQQQPTLL